MVLFADRIPWRAPALAALALAACAGPAPPGRPVAAGTTAAVPAGGAPDAAQAREWEERMRGIGVPPASPPPEAIDRVPGILRSSRPAPGVGPSATLPPGLPVPGNSQSRLSALPASPLANPRGGFMPGRP